MASILKVDTIQESTSGVGTNFATTGSASTPTISIGNQTNKGFYHEGTDKIGISVGGSKVGEIGIGYGGFTGNVIQVTNSLLTSQISITTAVSNTLRTSGIIGSITTKLNNSSILIFIASQGIYSGLSNYIYSIIYRSTSSWGANTAPSGTSLIQKHVIAGGTSGGTLNSITQLDSPNVPAGTTLYYGNSYSNNGTGTTITVNYDPAGFDASRSYASITLMEIAI